MTRGPTKAALRDLGTLFEAGTAAGLTDAQLLERFLDPRRGMEAAEVAFSALVERHGPMVLGVCRRVLRDASDAEDAFQSTFLVLIRKARSIQVTTSLGPWLYTVALRTAQEARVRAARRRARETQVVAMRHAETETDHDERWLELRGVLDGELGRLPERYRAPLVLCELEGRSRREAAVMLGVPEGTVSSRLSRGRALLRERLARRGLAVTTAALAVALSRETTAAPIPPALEALTVRAAMRIAAGHAATGAVSAQVAALTEGVLKAMLLTKLKGVFLVVVAGGVVAAGAGALAQAPSPSTTPAVVANPPAESGPGNDRLQALEQKIDRLLKAVESTEKAPGYRMMPPVMAPPPPATPTPAGVGMPDVPQLPGGSRRVARPGMAPPMTSSAEITERIGSGGSSAGAGYGYARAGGSSTSSEWRDDVERRLRQLEKRLDEVVSTLPPLRADGSPRGLYDPSTTLRPRPDGSPGGAHSPVPAPPRTTPPIEPIK